MTQNPVSTSYVASIARTRSTTNRNHAGGLAKPPTNAWHADPLHQIGSKQHKNQDAKESSGIAVMENTQKYPDMESQCETNEAKVAPPSRKVFTTK
jgi:hypothetical protein